MVHPETISTTFMVVSGVLGLVLFGLAVAAYRRNREPNLAFVAGAFTVFTIKSFLVGYSLATDLIEHDLLELVDAIGDLATVVLFVVPVFWPAR